MIASLLICILIAFANGTPCSDLSGRWRNQLGSNMTIRNIENSVKITGTYSTAVESSRGASAITSNLTGMVQPVEGGSLVAMNVLWNNGASLTVWVGQCLVCDGKEQLYTTWLLRSLMPEKKQWMSTRINQDTFYRVEGSAAEPPLQGPADEGESNSNLVGKWRSSNGDELEFSRASNEAKILAGLSRGSAALYGQYGGNATYTALGFVGVIEDEIRGWTGHILNPQEETPEITTSWLVHEFSHRCSIPQAEVEFGMNTYRRR